MEQALTAVFGLPGDPSYRYDGKTDQQIILDQMRWAGVAEEGISAGMDEVLDRYVELLEADLERTPEAARMCAGVPALLDALEAHDNATLGLLTGNIERG